MGGGEEVRSGRKGEAYNSTNSLSFTTIGIANFLSPGIRINIEEIQKIKEIKHTSANKQNIKLLTYFLASLT